MKRGAHLKGCLSELERGPPSKSTSERSPLLRNIPSHICIVLLATLKELVKEDSADNTQKSELTKMV